MNKIEFNSSTTVLVYGYFSEPDLDMFLSDKSKLQVLASRLQKELSKLCARGFDTFILYGDNRYARLAIKIASTVKNISPFINIVIIRDKFKSIDPDDFLYEAYSDIIITWENGAGADKEGFERYLLNSVSCVVSYSTVFAPEGILRHAGDKNIEVINLASLTQI